MALIRQRKLTKQQIRRIDKQQIESQDSIDDSLMDGVVISFRETCFREFCDGSWFPFDSKFMFRVIIKNEGIRTSH